MVSLSSYFWCFYVSVDWLCMVNFWFWFWLFSVNGLGIVVSFWSVFLLLDWVYFNCVWLRMHDWLSVMDLRNGFVMHLFCVLFSRFFVGDVHGRIVVFRN